MRNLCQSLSAALTLAMLLILGSPLLAQNRTAPVPDVVPLGSKVNGKTYSEWSARWWTWIAQTPIHDKRTGAVVHPFLDPTGEYAGYGQTGEVFFLVGGTDDTRTVTIPFRKKLFFPLLNWMYANFPTDPWATPEQLLSYVGTPSPDRVRNLHAEIDGNALANLSDYFAVSPEFVVRPLPDDNFWGLDTSDVSYFSQCMGTGWWVMLNPLPLGSHTLRFGGEVVSEADPSVVEFRIDRTYQITVTQH